MKLSDFKERMSSMDQFSNSEAYLDYDPSKYIRGKHIIDEKISNQQDPTIKKQFINNIPIYQNIPQERHIESETTNVHSNLNQNITNVPNTMMGMNPIGVVSQAHISSTNIPYKHEYVATGYANEGYKIEDNDEYHSDEHDYVEGNKNNFQNFNKDIQNLQNMNINQQNLNLNKDLNNLHISSSQPNISSDQTFTKAGSNEPIAYSNPEIIGTSDKNNLKYPTIHDINENVTLTSTHDQINPNSNIKVNFDTKKQ